MTIRVDRKTEKISGFISNDASYINLYEYLVAFGDVLSISAKVIAATEDGAQIVTFNLDGVYSNLNGTLECHGYESKGMNDVSTEFDAKLTILTDREPSGYVRLKIKGEAARYINWSTVIDITIRKDDVSYTGNPRMQLTIVGMEDARKLSFMGLKDGINYTLVPEKYTLTSTPSPVLLSEQWGLRFPKTLGTYVCMDMLGFTARAQASTGTIITNRFSGFNLRWWTYTGFSGTGSLTLVRTQGTYSGSLVNINGYLRDRVLGRSYTSPEGVTFLWSRCDVRGWGNYPVM